MLVRIAGLVPESFVDGKGIRFAVFMQGCLRHCPGCHNPDTHTGGEPLLQIPPAIELAKAAKPSGLSVWLYTGYRFEDLPADAAPLIELVDVLVDGAFLINQLDLDLPFRGSRNQRLIDIPESLRLNKIVLWTQ